MFFRERTEVMVNPVASEAEDCRVHATISLRLLTHHLLHPPPEVRAVSPLSPLTATLTWSAKTKLARNQANKGTKNKTPDSAHSTERERERTKQVNTSTTAPPRHHRRVQERREVAKKKSGGRGE